MRYDNQQLTDQLAAEYVLGTLHGGARARFEDLLKYRPEMQRQVSQWQQNFIPLVMSQSAIQAPKAIWQHLQARLDGSQQHPAKRSRFWQGWSALTTVLSVALLAVLLQFTAPPPERTLDPLAQQVAFVGADDAPLWVISADLQSGELTARAVNATAAGMDQAFELWMLPLEGAPQSIGLLPVNGGKVTHKLPAGLSALLAESKGLAISIEPATGSPTGAPTGPVIETTSIWEL